MNKPARKNVLAVAAGVLLVTAAKWLVDSRSARHRLSGRVALLTGGSRGLGLEIARELAKEGCKLILVARSYDELLLSQQELAQAGANVEIIACNLAVQDQLAAMLKKAMAIHGRIDIVINNAGRIDVGPVDSFTETDFHAAMDLMFWAPLRIVLGLLPSLLQSQDADIVNICSIGGEIAVPHLLAYASAKFALTGLSQGLDAELPTRGVHILTVTPGLLRTGSHKKAAFSGNKKQEYRWFALGATLPVASMQVTRAARQIVSALKARKRSLTLGWSAQVAARLHGAFPELAIHAMGGMNALLPNASTSSIKQKGQELVQAGSPIFKAVTSLGELAAQTQNENS